MGKPYSCIKITLLILNTIFLVFGIILMFIGGLALNNLKDVSELFQTSLPVGVVVVGLFIFILSFFGCCGAAIENKFMLLVYIFILFGLMICQLAIGGAAYNLSDSIEAPMRNTWDKMDNNSRYYIEDKFDCCGWNAGDCPDKNITACGIVVPTYFEERMQLLAIVGIVFGCLELIGLFFALILYCCISRKRKREKKERLLG